MDDKWKHPTKEEQNVLLALLKSFDGFLNGTLIMWNISQVKFYLKVDVKPLRSQPYPVLKSHKSIFKKEV